MFAANDNIKAMAESGELQSLHEKYNSLREKAHTEYINVRQKLNNIVVAAQNQEDEISKEASNDYPGLNLKLHNASDYDFSTLLESRGLITVKNLKSLSDFKS